MLDLDSIDQHILAELALQGRLSNHELSERVGLSPTPCARRVKRLEQEGLIRGYHADINPKARGMTICVMISVRLAKHKPDGHSAFRETIGKSQEVVECFMVTGNADYILKAWFPDIDALRHFITTTVQNLPEVAETSTMLVVDTIVSGARQQAFSTP
ncbi:Lrp/AsnC family transcriptional regulator [Loktanella sp. M215]|uniref:Lrp/AsnC family transcriptional regulator n=1 Tax=Loktanella sp. M215 TaxID=2675431 RepID=UPI001F20988E|nr:Lrp/AsnC family transcriptional regulator [Loktanella sp. M215]MCF7702251.1 winged helix-turn-helix transcriptional regulator [Loktanella sp. M215]